MLKYDALRLLGIVLVNDNSFKMSLLSSIDFWRKMKIIGFSCKMKILIVKKLIFLATCWVSNDHTMSMNVLEW